MMTKWRRWSISRYDRADAYIGVGSVPRLTCLLFVTKSKAICQRSSTEATLHSCKIDVALVHRSKLLRGLDLQQQTVP
jgi:hypothetical protein